MDKKITEYFEQTGMKHTEITHRTVYTAFNAAETQHVNPKEVVKTVLVKFDKQIAFLEETKGAVEKFNLVLVAVPAGKHLDFKKIDKFVFDTQTKLYKKLVKQNPKLPKPIKVKSSVAKEKDIADKLKTKFLLAPLPVYGLPVLLDKKLALAKNLIFTAGSFTESVKVATAAYLKTTSPILGAFGK
jgi:prolyl-tRNA editing enzyme YbaK/EbsC (Cys-tRNA(Pro) deacylase)